MKAIFAAMALVLVLAIVGSIAKKQLQAIGPGVSASSAALAGSAPTFAAAPNAATIAEQGKTMQERARAETVRALAQGAQRTQRSDP